MFKVTTSLFISSFDLEINDKCFVSKKEDVYDPIVLEIESKHLSIIDALSELFEEHVDLKFSYVKPMLVDVLKKEDRINVFFSCSVPPGTELKNCYYINKHLALIDPMARKSSLYV